MGKRKVTQEAMAKGLQGAFEGVVNAMTGQGKAKDLGRIKEQAKYIVAAFMVQADLLAQEVDREHGERYLAFWSEVVEQFKEQSEGEYVVALPVGLPMRSKVAPETVSPLIDIHTPKGGK